MKGFIVAILKYGGLSLSAGLTIWLFSDLFWNKTPLGLLLIVASFILFEGGALLWIELVPHAKGIQFIVAWACAWLCVAASVLSSVSQIVLATNLYDTGGFDMALFTLLLIGAALFTNVGGIILFQFLDPDVMSTQMNMLADSLASLRARDKVNEIWKKADVEADKILAGKMSEIAARIARERADDVVRLALAASPGGNNTGKVIPQPQGRSQLPYQNQSFPANRPPQSSPAQLGPMSGFMKNQLGEDDDEEETVHIPTYPKSPSGNGQRPTMPPSHNSNGPRGK